MSANSCITKFFAALLAVCFTWSTPGGASADENASDQRPIKIYLDADRSVATSSGDSIEAGIQAAIAEFGGAVHGRSIEIVNKDHRGNIKRSKRSLEAFARDPDALAIFCGMHSPPVLIHRDFINTNHLLLLDPWAAAGPITRPDTTDENWIFRLSIDDTNAGTFIADEAIARGITKPHLMLEDTGWGKSNFNTMTEAIKSSLGTESGVTWFNWGIAEESMRINLREITASGADAVFFVGNAPEGAKLIRAMAQLPEADRIPIYSHWGITGGTLQTQVSEEHIARVDLKFIQTRGSLKNAEVGSLGHRAFTHARNADMLDQVRSPRELVAPTGFIHAFDLTTILLHAIDAVELTGDAETDRDSIRIALEQLDTPVNGIMRTYDKPFSPYDEVGSDAHEALGMDDYTLARYASDGVIEHLPVLSRTEGPHAGVDVEN